MPSPLSFILILGLIALLAAAGVLVVRSARGETNLKRRLARELGFVPVADGAALMRHLARVRGRQRPGQLQLTHVFHRREAPGEQWLYSLHRRDFNDAGMRSGARPRNADYSPLELDATALVVPGWNWPRCVATPRLVGQGPLSGFSNRMAETRVEANARHLDFPNVFGLDEYYFVACYDKVPDLPEAFLQALAAAPGLILHLGGDTLTLSWANARVQPPDAARMRLLVEQARRFAQALGAPAPDHARSISIASP